MNLDIQNVRVYIYLYVYCVQRFQHSSKEVYKEAYIHVLTYRRETTSLHNVFLKKEICKKCIYILCVDVEL